MGVSWDFASTTTLVVLEDATQVCEDPQSWDGGQPPQVCPQPSSPHVFPLQLGVQLTPPSGAAPVDPPEAVPPVPPLPPETPPEPTTPPAPVGDVAAVFVPQPRMAQSATTTTRGRNRRGRSFKKLSYR